MRGKRRLSLRACARCGVLLPILLVLGGCSAPPASPGSPPGTARSAATTNGAAITVTDARGQTLRLSAPPRRIVSLAPSDTEVLFALGAGDRIAADTTACLWPPEARTKPHIGGFDMSLESIEAQNPDLVVAVTSINTKIVSGLESAHIPVLAANPKTVPDIYDSIRLLGKVTGEDARAEQIVSEMQTRIDAVRKATSTAKTRPKVLILHDVSPLYTTGPGSFIDDAISIAGGQNIATQNTISPEKVVALAPDVIICSSVLRPQIQKIPGWAQGVPAVRNGAFFSDSPDATISRPVPVLAKGIEELARFLHPDLFPGSGKPAGAAHAAAP